MWKSSFLACLGLAGAALAAPDGQHLPNGIWRSDGFGYLAIADGEEVRTFEFSLAGCVSGPSYSPDAFQELFGTSIPTGTTNIELQRGPTRDFLVQLDTLPDDCTTPLQGDDPAVNLAVFTQTFTDYYAFFAERGVDWQAHLSTILPGPDLFAALTALVAPLDDGHVSIDAGDQTFELETIKAPGLAPDGSSWTWRTLRSSLREYLQGSDSPLTSPAILIGNKRVLYGRVGDDVGYIAILAEGGWAEDQSEEDPSHEHAAVAADVLDAVLGEIGDVRGMVIDLRVNSGGFDEVSLEIASRFTREPLLAFTRQARRDSSPRYDVMLEPSSRRSFDGPVAVLIGPNTVSAGETAALAFAALPHARLFGQPTRGILSDAIPKTLPNGWTFTLSVETLRTPEGDIVEVAGVQPDEATAVPADSSGASLWGADLQAASRWAIDKAKR